MSAAVTTGLFTLGGVIVGGSLNAVMSYALARRVERREARAAARLVIEELAQIRYALADVRDDGRWRPIDFVTLDQWREHRDRLAHHLRPSDWRCVSAAYVDVERLRAWIDANTVSGTLEPEDRPSVVAVHDAVQHALVSHLVQLSVHGPQRRSLARSYHRWRSNRRRPTT
jgi:hypothetical protein